MKTAKTTKLTYGDTMHHTSLGPAPTMNLERPVSPFVHADDTLGRARHLSQRVQNLAERLLSHFPDIDNVAAPAPSNILATLDMSCTDADAAINRANAALDAIESALP